MSQSGAPEQGADLAKGVAFADLADGGMIAGHVNGEPVLIARRGDELFAIGASCTHYGGPLGEGIVVGDTVRCPWHHACFSLRTGEAVRAPALDPVARWSVERRGDRVYVTGKLPAAAPRRTLPAGTNAPESVVIVGGGAAGASAAETLRREGYDGPVTILSADADPPCDRPNLSKGLLSGGATAEAVVLRAPAFYRDLRVELKLGARVAGLDTGRRTLRLESGERHAYGSLLLATGADVVRLEVPGADLPHVRYLRSFADGRALLERATAAKRVVVIGASFIGLEVAASLRTRGAEVDVVAPGRVPMERVLGGRAGAGFQRLHEKKGVRFHLGTKPAAIAADSVTLTNGERLAADLVVVGIGVRPSLELAERAGLAIERGVLVNEFLETSVPGIFAAGDIARWPDPLSGQRIRVEHWTVAQRQGRTAALNILGRRERFTAVPFFWTEQYDLSLVYVGHAEQWDAVEFEGEVDQYDCGITYRLGGRKLAYASVYRDHPSLRAEVEMEAAVEALAGGVSR
ncbi:MAG: FAD-dependent oxidoreductase [Candidatus Eisenbacteria bacterium]|nr:FAD-dependent oxidoreductase [Candidatus Eisenbacteria bacterium]